MAKPRQVIVLFHPLQTGSPPLLWRDWGRRKHRRACRQLVRPQRIEVGLLSATAGPLYQAEGILSRAQRAPSRLSWSERLTRHARVSPSGHVVIRVCGVPGSAPRSLGLAMADPRPENWWVPSSRKSTLLRAGPHGLFSWPFLHSCSLPPSSLSVLLVLPSLTGWASRFEPPSLF